jgi:hypothetical protein
MNQSGLRGRVTNVGIGFGAFLLTCTGLHVILPFPAIDDGVSQKLRSFAAHKDEFDTLFIGSSRVYFQISPAIFDRVMREEGIPTRSFNFGIGGMFLPESAYVLEQLLNTKPRNLKWVFIEYDELQTKWASENQTSRRALYWADWKRTSLLLRKLTDVGIGAVWLPSPRKLRDIILCRKGEANTYKELMFHTAQLEKNFVNVARAADILDCFLGRNTSKWDPKYLGAAGDGYIPKAGGMSASQAAAYERALGLAMGTKPPVSSISPYTVEAYRQCAQKVRAIGAEPIFLITPSATQINIPYRDTKARPPGVVMAFNDPGAYPNLYRSSVRRDQQHLTKSGGEEFTRIMAVNFAELIQAGEVKRLETNARLLNSTSASHTNVLR